MKIKGYSNKMTLAPLKCDFLPLTHQSDIKEQALMKVNCCVARFHLCLGQNVARVSVPACMLGTCVRGGNFIYQQVAVVCIHSSERETRRFRTVD